MGAWGFFILGMKQKESQIPLRIANFGLRISTPRREAPIDVALPSKAAMNLASLRNLRFQIHCANQFARVKSRHVCQSMISVCQTDLKALQLVLSVCQAAFSVSQTVHLPGHPVFKGESDGAFSASADSFGASGGLFVCQTKFSVDQPVLSV